MRKVFILAFLILSAFLTACGGGGGGGGSSGGTGGGSGGGGGGGSGGGPANPFAGTYSANYTRSSIPGSLTIAVGTNGVASIVITDSQAGVFVGNGTVGNTGQLTATATNRQTQNSVTVSGQFVNQGGTITASGSITGSISVSQWTASKIAEVGVNAFAGKWSGIYSGDESGSWTGVIQNDGSVNATATSLSAGTVTLTGTVSPAGLGTLSGSGTGAGGPFTITWEGTFYMQGNDAVGSGTWTSSSGFRGVWRGQRTGR